MVAVEVISDAALVFTAQFERQVAGDMARTDSVFDPAGSADDFYRNVCDASSSLDDVVERWAVGEHALSPGLKEHA